MKRLLLAALGLAAVAGTSALAADMPRGRPLPPPRAPAYVPFFTWNGFYVGLNAGYGFGHSTWTDTVTQFSAGSFNVTVHNIDAATAEVGAIIINFALIKAVSS